MLQSEEDDDAEVFDGGVYDNGHWEWDDTEGELIFVSHFIPDWEAGVSQAKVHISTTNIEFRDEIDLIEQDLKDLAIYTAPSKIMNSTLIDFLHLPTTEKLIRAVILYCQYYIQVSDEMENRMIEMENKIRTEECDVIENELRDSLCDLRILVAKEYCTMILEIEINRLFKSDSYNVVEHTLQTKYLSRMSKVKRDVLVGACVKKDVKMQNYSPLMNEVTCERPIDYRLMGLGVIEVPKITSRLKYMLSLVCEPEEDLASQGLTLGIIGLPRERFDTMLYPIVMSTTTGSSSSKSRTAMSSKSKSSRILKLYPDMSLPVRDPGEPFYPPEFPSKTPRPRACSEMQRRRWQQRLNRQRQPVFHSRTSLK